MNIFSGAAPRGSKTVHMRVYASMLLAACSMFARADVEDVLSRPSMPSAKAGQAVMLAVERAGDRLVAVGERGITLVSDSGGRQWSQVSTPVSVTLTAVQFPDPRNGFAVGHGGVVIGTKDGGSTWQRLLNGRKAADLILKDVESRAGHDSTERAALVAEAKRGIEDGPDKPFLDVHFSNPTNGLIVGAFGMAFATEDAGVTWKPVEHLIPNKKHKHLYRIVAYKDLLWLVGEQGALFFSRDGGRTFEDKPLPYGGTLFGLVAVTDREWLVYGLRGNVFHTTDAGATWARIDNPAGSTVTHGQVLSDGRVVLVDQSGRVLVAATTTHSLMPLAKGSASAINALTQAPDGALVLATMRGMDRLAAKPVEHK